MPPPRRRLAFGGAVESGAVLGVWRHQPFDPPTATAGVQLSVELPLKSQPSIAELEREVAAAPDRPTAERAHRKLARVRHVGTGPTCAMPAWIWRLGRTFVVGHPNEAYSALQVSLRAAAPGHAVVVMNLVNGSCGYLYPPELAHPGLYAAWQSPFAPAALPRLVDACETQLTRMVEAGSLA
jgi:hypothetical protein